MAEEEHIANRGKFIHGGRPKENQKPKAQSPKRVTQKVTKKGTRRITARAEGNIDAKMKTRKATWSLRGSSPTTPFFPRSRKRF